MNRQQMRQVLECLGFWTHEHRTGWPVRSGPSKDTTLFPGLFLNAYNGLAYFTMKPSEVKGIQLPRGRWPAPDLWVELALMEVGSKQRTGGRRNYAPRDGRECEAVRQFLS